MNQVTNRRLSAPQWTLLIYWCCILLATHWPKLKVDHSDRHFLFPHSDKVVHFVFYAGWTWLACRVTVRSRWRYQPLIIFLVGATYAAVDELTQAWVNRTPSWADFAADLAGISIVLLSFHLLRRRSNPSCC